MQFATSPTAAQTLRTRTSVGSACGRVGLAGESELVAGFKWMPGIGDPTIAGWVTVGLYLAASVVCWWVWRGHDGAGPFRDREIRAWRWLAALLLALGINKQLDLQTAVTEAGRMLAHRQGWYDQREIVQLWFVIVVAALGLVAVTLLVVWTRRAGGATRLAMLGASLVLTFVVIRAASFHHVDRFINERFLGLRWNWILEIGGISLVLLAGLCRRHARRVPRS
jgi:hypothetical protein